MPRFVPHRSSVHRIAALALYRALLSQCHALALPAPESALVQNVIRSRFRDQRFVTSHRQLRVSFSAGYEAVDLFDRAVAGDEECRDRIVELARGTWVTREVVPKAGVEKKKKKVWSTPRTSVLSRPVGREKLKGVRRVPVLFSANRIPVLRLGKPQPRALSGFLNARIGQRQRRHDRRWALEGMLEVARGEDVWDGILEGRGWAGREGGWGVEVRGALDTVVGDLEGERVKNREMAERMQGVVDRERALFEREREEDKAARRAAWEAAWEAAKGLEREREKMEAERLNGEAPVLEFKPL